MSRLAKIKTLGLSALLLGGMAAGGVVMAQDQQVPAHPANVLAGTCDNLDPVPKAQLSHVTVQVNDGEEQDANTPRGVLTASRVLLSSTEDVELPLEDILSSAHSISIYLSDAEIDTPIACGEIGGIVVDENLYFGLWPMNDSGYSGIAHLTEDGDNTTFDIFLTEPTDQTAPATPVT